MNKKKRVKTRVKVDFEQGFEVVYNYCRNLTCLTLCLVLNWVFIIAFEYYLWLITTLYVHIHQCWELGEMIIIMIMLVKMMRLIMCSWWLLMMLMRLIGGSEDVHIFHSYIYIQMIWIFSYDHMLWWIRCRIWISVNIHDFELVFSLKWIS